MAEKGVKLHISNRELVCLNLHIFVFQPCMSDFYYWLIERWVHGWKNGRMGGFMDGWFCERKGLLIDK